MPQFDFTTYSSQIFWFLICFAIIYYFSSFIILPRIRNIIALRRSVIDQDINLAQSLEKQIDELHSKTNSLNLEANKKYQAKLDEVMKDAAKKKEQMIEDLKNKIDSKIESSRKEIKEFLINSQKNSDASINGIAQLIKTKILN